jgi:hypothetical protein
MAADGRVFDIYIPPGATLNVTLKLDESGLAELRSINLNLKKIMTDLTALTAEVEETKTVAESAVVLITGLADALRAAGTDPVKLGELQAQLDTSNAKLAAAVSANTPSA